jgi:hypothetical protein
MGAPVDDSNPPSRADVVVVGAGLAGLACARRLLAARPDLDVAVLEAGDDVGGRVRTDVVDGFRADRGFQLFNPSYPEARRVLDLRALRLRPLPAGVVVAAGNRRVLLTDPRRTPVRALPRALAGAVTSLGGPREKLAFARWALRAGYADPAELLQAPDEPWGTALDRLGVTGPLRHAVLENFLAGTLAERDGSTSRRFVELLVRSFVHGSPSVPWDGMAAMPRQLAAGLPEGRLHLRTPVTGIAQGRVRTVSGTTAATAVVVATDPATAGRLTGIAPPRTRPLTTYWHVADEPPTRSGALHVDGDRRGPIVNSVVLSRSAPGYSPDGRALVASTVLEGTADVGTEAAVRAQLRYVYGVETSRWQLLVAHAVPRALTAMEPPLHERRPVELGNGLFVAGDHRDTASIQGALVSGRRAADAVLERLGLPVPPRPPLDGVSVLPRPAQAVSRAR